MRIGLLNFRPLMSCDESITSNFIPALIESIFEDINYNKSSIKYICYDTTSLMKDALSNGDISIAPLEMNEEVLSLFKFSVPVLNNGLVLLTKSYKRSLYWVIFEPYEIQLWIFLFILPFVIGHLYWLFERSKHGSVSTNYLDGITTSIWRVCLSFLFLAKEHLTKFSTRLVITTYWFFSLILLASYISTLASCLNQPIQITDISSYKNINGKTIGTEASYSNLLTYLGANIKIYKDPQTKFIDMIDGLIQGDVDAVALPYSVGINTSLENCDLSLIGTIFVDSYLAFAFNEKVHDKFYNQFNSILQGYHDNLSLKTLINKHLYVSTIGACETNIPFPLPPELVLGCLMFLIFGAVFAMGIYFIFRKSLIKTRINSSELPQGNNLVNDKYTMEFMNMMIKFECILGSSNTKFVKKINELKEVIDENTKLSEKFEEMYKNISFRLEN
ncbi:hypothetical protein SteCoe_3612 [Stentor coeruleus]|uniref:Ionotropic glutamate receptor C-terminal domain-containing protein n=1 Tax=Stentor coeruleus TaxID=5963 RepID=A0A1R2CWI8_9CILI|nr:hypothetical protein SteCoe_3612 [Stentor coeruleus]